MSSDDQTVPEGLADRLLKLEEAVAHLQHDMEDLNQSLTRHFRHLTEFRERFVRLEHELERLSDPDRPREPDEERPPHY